MYDHGDYNSSFALNPVELKTILLILGQAQIRVNSLSTSVVC